MVIETGRLRIVPLDADALNMLIDDSEKFQEEYNVRYDAQPVEGEYKNMLLRQSEAVSDDEDNYYWNTLWLIAKEGTAIGGIYFKGCPSDGVVEIGYGQNKKYEGKGYMSEAVKAFLSFAFLSGAERVIAETEKNNVKSQNVLKRCGFAPYMQGKTIWWEKKR